MSQLPDAFKHGVAAHVEFRLVGPGRGVVSPMDDRRVGLALAVADILGFFQQRNGKAVARKLARRGAADHAAADEDHVIKHRIYLHLFEKLTGWRRRLAGQPPVRDALIRQSSVSTFGAVISFTKGGLRDAATPKAPF